MRTFATLLAITIGAGLTVIGAVSIYVGEPHPELCTLGVGLILATGLVGKLNGKGR